MYVSCEKLKNITVRFGICSISLSITILFFSCSTNDNYSTFIENGVAKYNQGDNQGAIEEYTKAVELDPMNPLAYRKRGFAKIGFDNNSALKDYNKAIELDPTDKVAYKCRAKCNRSLGDLNGSLEDYNKAIELESDSSIKTIIKITCIEPIRRELFINTEINSFDSFLRHLDEYDDIWKTVILNQEQFENLFNTVIAFRNITEDPVKLKKLQDEILKGNITKKQFLQTLPPERGAYEIFDDLWGSIIGDKETLKRIGPISSH